MTQHDYNIANGSGATVRADINALAEAIGSANSGAAQPATLFPHMPWFDTANALLKRRNGANTAWVTELDVLGALLADGSNLPARTKWRLMPIGQIYLVDTSRAGIEVPPADAGFILLSTGEDGVGEYNENKVANETITGSGATLVATFDINDIDSPLNGQTWHCLNDEERVIYAGVGAKAGNVFGDQMQQITGSVGYLMQTAGGSSAAAGALSKTGLTVTSEGGSNARNIFNIALDSANSPDARAGDRTRAKGMQLVSYLKYKDVV